MKKKNALFICRRERGQLLLSIADALKDKGAISKANAFYLGDPEGYTGYLNGFDGVYNEIDIFSPDLSMLEGSRITYLKDKYTNEFYFWNALFSERSLVQIEQNIHTPPFGYKSEYGQALIIKALHHADLLITKYKPDFIFDISALGLQRAAIYSVGKCHGIPFMLLNRSLVGLLYTLYDDLEWNSETINNHYHQLSLLKNNEMVSLNGNSAINKLASTGSIYVGHGVVPSKKNRNEISGHRWAAQNSISRKMFIGKKLAIKAFQLQKSRMTYKSKGIFNYIDDRHSTSDIFFGPIRRRFRETQNKKIFEDKGFFRLGNQDQKKKILFTWHLQPELSTSQQAPFHVNQEIFVQNIARVVPFDAVIIVKPHPRTTGKVDPRLFQFVRQLPNVYFMDPNDSITELLPECYAVVTLTGTVGLEALAMGVPTFYFGSPKWRVCKSAHFCRTFEELGDCLRNIDQFLPDRNDVACYIQAVIDESVDLCSTANVIRQDPKTVPEEEYQEAVENITKLIVRKLDYIENLDRFPLQK